MHLHQQRMTGDKKDAHTDPSVTEMPEYGRFLGASKLESRCGGDDG